MVPWVHEALKDVVGVDAQLLEDLATVRDAALRDHLAALAALDDAARILEGAQLPWMVVKGPALAYTIYARPDLRDYGDLDLVVRREDFGDVLDAFEVQGYPSLVADWDLLRERGAAQVQVRMRHSIADVHWHLLHWSRVREAVTIDMDALFSRRRMVDVAGRPVPTLDPVDTVLHLALHAATSGGLRLIWLEDIEQAVATDELDWDELVRRADETGMRLVAAVMLRRSRRVLGADVP
ncbi:MAG: nucleotidyltransferase family protein, partial [Gemmatimonadota bacterium]